MKNELTVVIPAYNEEGSIESTIRQVSKDVPGAKILVVNDKSTDNTLEILKRLKKKYKNLGIINHSKNRGYGGALKTGFSSTKTKYLAFLDADLTYPPKYIPVMLSKVKAKNLDCAWCNRFAGRSQMPLVRKFGNKMLVALFFIVTLRHLPDISSGERLFKKKSLEKIDYRTLPNGLDMITAMSKRIVKRKLKYSLVKCNYLQRGGSSKLNIVTDFLRMSRNIIIEK